MEIDQKAVSLVSLFNTCTIDYWCIASAITNLDVREYYFSASVGFSFSLQDDFETRFKHLCGKYY